VSAVEAHRHNADHLDGRAPQHCGWDGSTPAERKRKHTSTQPLFPYQAAYRVVYRHACTVLGHQLHSAFADQLIMKANTLLPLAATA
jgi:hypothetical protein